MLIGGAVVLLPRPEPSTTVGRTGPAAPTLEEGVLTVGVAPTPPYSIPGAQGPVGFDVDVVREVASRLGLGTRIVPAGEDPFALLQDGGADVAAGARISAELEERVNLSDPYLRVLQALAVNRDARPDLDGLDDLGEGDEVAVVEGSTGHAWATAALQPDAIVLRPYRTLEAAAVALAAGSVDGLIADEAAAMAALEGRPSLLIVDAVPTGTGLGIAVDPGNGRLLAAVNEALVGIAADGTYDRLYDRYGSALPPGGRITSGRR